MSFTDQKPRIATADDLKANWGGSPSGQRFRCYMCGHRFVVGDQWRWVSGKGTINFLVCAECDGPDIFVRWTEHVAESQKRFWWLY
jgi:hypothetical protein